MNNPKKIKITRKELLESFALWLDAWDNFDLNEIMNLFHNDIVFENWDGTVIKGKSLLEKSWRIWFSKGKIFKFVNEDIFVDVEEQKLLFRWELEWLSHEEGFKEENEIRRGVDVIHFVNGKIIKKLSYSKTKIKIGSISVILKAKK